MSYLIAEQLQNLVTDTTNDAEQIDKVIKQVTIFNGTTQAASGTLAHAAATGLGPFSTMSVVAQLVGATGGTLDLYLQGSSDGGTTWFDVAHYTQLAAAASAVDKVFALSKGGQQTTITTTGVGTTAAPGVALAAGTVVGGDWGDRLRLVEVAGSGTSAGAAIIIQATLTS